MTRPRPTLRALSWPDRLVFALGAVGWLHFIDATTWHAQPNSGAFERTLQFVLAIASGPLLAAGYLRLGTKSRGLATFLAGIPLLATGITIHIVGTVKDGFGSGDGTGIAIAFAGLGLVLTGLLKLETAIPRWRWRLATLPLAAPLLLWVLLPATMVVFVTHAPRYEITAQDLGAEYEEVSFQTSDGLTLRGWYVPSKNGAAVAVLHGSSGARIRPLLHIRMLQAHGYGVLAYDTRGHGESDGTTNALGWNAEKDASAALDYLESRDDVEPGRVGLLGLSMGAEIALEMATNDHSAAAIVADGAGVRSSREMKDVSFGWSKFVSYPVAAGMTWGTALFRLEMPPAALSGYIDDIQTPVFYIASDQIAEERELNETWSKLTTSEHQLWKADASHTGGLKTQPKEYESRVMAWFDAHLLEKAR